MLEERKGLSADASSGSLESVEQLVVAVRRLLLPIISDNLRESPEAL